MIKIPSPSGHEKELLLYLEEQVRLDCWPVARLPVGPESYDLLVNPREQPALLIDIHADTVPETIAGDPCLCREEGGRVYGRGAADAKGSLVALLAALKLVQEQGISPAALPVTIAFTVDEEREARGSEVLAAHVRAGSALVMEPTGLALAIAQAGSLVARLTFAGFPAHGSEFEAGRNAIQVAWNFFDELARHPVITASHPLIGGGGFNIRQITGGSEELAVPAQCTVLVDFRIQPDQDIARVQETLAELFAAREIAYDFIEISPSYSLRGDEQVIATFQEAYRQVRKEEVRVTGMKSWTDAENLVDAGIPAIIFGPGDLKIAHTPWENIAVAEVEAAARVLAHLLLSFTALP